MKRYWCYTCSDWKGPFAADECAAHDHHVVSAEKKAEIDNAQNERILKIVKERGPVPEGTIEEIVGAEVSHELEKLLVAGKISVTEDFKIKVNP